MTLVKKGFAITQGFDIDAQCDCPGGGQGCTRDNCGCTRPKSGCGCPTIHYYCYYDGSCSGGHCPSDMPVKPAS